MSNAMNVLRHLEARAPKAGLARAFYLEEELYRLDLELIFYREWLFAAHEAELTETGSYLTLQIGTYPIVLVRSASGIIRAFITVSQRKHQI